MKNKIRKILQEINQADKSRTIKLSIFLLLLISVPLILNVSQTPQNLKQYAQIVPQGIFPVYGLNANVLDNLKSGWTASILYGGPTAYDLYNKAPVYYGTNSIAYTVTSPWDELKLISPATFDISDYIYLTFYAQGGSPNMRFGVMLLGADNNPLPTMLPIDNYGGSPPVGGWGVYNVPLSAFNATGQQIKGVGFKDLNGGTMGNPPPPIYIDEINFSTQQGQNLPPPSGAAQITGPTLIPTSIMPYYPDINPWVFIIPGIIIGLAVIFQ